MEKIILELEAKSDKAISEIEELKKEIEGLQKQTQEGNKKTEKSFNVLGKTLGGISKLFKGALGIGIVVQAFKMLKDIFMQNQKVADTFKNVIETASIVFNELVGVLVNVYENVTKSKDSFDALGKVVKGLLTVAFTPLKLAFFSIKLGVQQAQLAWEQSFFGGKDPDKIADLIIGINETKAAIYDTGTEAVEAGKSIVNNFGEAVSEVGDVGKQIVEGVSNISIKAAQEAAKTNVQLEKSAKLAEVANQGLIEKYDRQAEQLRQTRDDESKSFEERIKANEELGKLLDEQEKAMMANAQIRVAQTAAELAKNKENIDLQVAYQEALNEQAAIEAQITGFRSEQQTNANSLLREQKDLQNELALIGKTERELERLELKQDYDAKKLLIEREIQDEILKKEALANLETDYNTKIAAIDQAALDEKIAKAAQERELEKQKIQDKQMVLDAVSQFADAETGIGKALLIAKQALALQEILLDVKRITFKGTQAVGEAGINAAQNVSESSKIGFPQNIITIAAAIGQGLAIIKSVKKAVGRTKAAGVGSASAPSISTPSAPASQPPAFNIVGASGTNQLAETIAGQQQQPVKAYVVSQDVTTAQSLERNIVQGASI